MNTQPGPRVGKIVSSNSHIDYVCQVYGPGEYDPLPGPQDYAFGSFVAIQADDARAPAGRLIGVIYNTLLVNPDYGNLGPRLSPRQDLTVFSPDYLSETATLVGVMALGWIDPAGQVSQGAPALAATINAPVRRLSDDEVRKFHRGADGRLRLHYLPLLMAQSDPLIAPLLLTMVDRLRDLFPDQRQRLAVMRNNLAWKQVVRPAG